MSKSVLCRMSTLNRLRGFIRLHTCKSFSVFLLLFVFSTSKACNVPVFRYALERWTAAIYQIIVYTQNEDESGALELLRKNAAANSSLSNYSLTAIDVTTTEGNRLARTNQVAQFPWVAVYYPANAQVRGLVWEGPLNADIARRLIDSPARFALAEKLLGGEVAVYLLLKSGDLKKDEKARNVLEKTLKKASHELKIPNTGVDINGNAIEVTDFVDYDVHFDLIEISRDDPQEIFLRSMLLGSESDLAWYNEPMVFPVFGRGRSLYAIIGKGINEKNIYDACRSITAWCSCEIKAQNPGIDLLLSADWSTLVGGHMVKDEEAPPLTGFSEFITPQNDAQEPDVVKLADERKGNPVEIDAMKVESIIKDTVTTFNEGHNIQESSNTLLRNLLLLAGVGIVLVFMSTFFLKSKKHE